MFSFEKLELYKKTKKFVKNVYSITGEFPESEKYSLVSQLNRAAISVISNIVEGNSKTSYKE